MLPEYHAFPDLFYAGRIKMSSSRVWGQDVQKKFDKRGRGVNTENF